ncbi:MAG TPA: DHHA1 domain-containing protein [bacterium]|nr:DHHA1 domain-containing protein [bacterium]
MTERLYYADAYLCAFTARVLEAIGPGRDRPGGLVLDRTAFYPTSGGQPHDTGTLAGYPVVDVVDSGDTIIHVLDGRDPSGGLVPGAEVAGEVNWPCRFDHMQQHTAQHLLSAVFLDLLRAPTVSVHLGESCTLDLDVAALDAEAVRRVEDTANQIVYEDRSVTVRFVDASEAETLGLRRPPGRTGTLRIVEIAGCDRSACGGTHVRSTGELGPVLIRRWERSRGRLRAEFLAGWRAVRDYQWKHALISEWSGRLTVRDRELGQALERVVAEGRVRERVLQDARKQLLRYEAADRIAALPAGSEGRVLRLLFPSRDGDEVRALLREMTALSRAVVLAGVVDTGRLWFGRTPGAGPDLAAVLSRACREVGGRGGGTAEFAQGAVPPGDAVARALAVAEEEVRRA